MSQQIRFMRPNPQYVLTDLFLRGFKTDRSVFIMIDPAFVGYPDYFNPNKRHIIWYNDGVAAVKRGYEILEETLKLLKSNNWKCKFYSLLKCEDRQAIKIIEKISNNEVIKTSKAPIDDTRALIVFALNYYLNQHTQETINQYSKLGKPICVIDQFAVKRYPRDSIIF
jgi:hypothetical protein